MEQCISLGETRLWTHASADEPGSKPTMLLWGGGPGLSDGLAEVDPLINSRYRTIRFDPRGCGRSTEDGRYDMDTAIDDVEAIRQFYQVDRWHMLGHSWGADLSLFYAIKYPQHCLRVMHFCGLGVQNDKDWSEECAANNEYEPEGTPTGNPYPMNYDVLDQAIRSYEKYIQRPMLPRSIATLQVPFFVVCSRKDPRPMWPNLQLANLLPVAQLKVLEDCGHFPWLKQPDLVANMVFGWFE